MYKKITTLILCMSITISSAPLYASSTVETKGPLQLDLRITTLDSGVPAPFTGILLTTDSLTKMKIEFDKNLAKITLKLEHNEKLHKLRLNFLDEKLQQEIIFRNTQLDMRDKYIEELEKKFLEKDDLSPWWITSSFLVGCLTTIAIAYSLQSAYR